MKRNQTNQKQLGAKQFVRNGVKKKEKLLFAAVGLCCIDTQDEFSFCNSTRIE